VSMKQGVPIGLALIVLSFFLNAPVAMEVHSSNQSMAYYVSTDSTKFGLLILSVLSWLLALRSYSLEQKN